MELKEHEKTKLNDFAAHRDSLKKELSIVNENLEEALSQKTDAEDSHAKILEQIVIASEELSRFQEKRNEEEASLDSRIENTAQEEARLATDKATFESYKEIQNNLIDSRKNALEASILSKQDEIVLLDIKISEASSKIPVLEDKISILTDKITVLTTEYNKLCESNALEEKRHDDRIVELRSDEATANKNLESVKKQLAEESEKIGSADENLLERGLAVSKRETNFEIMYQRLNKEFQKRYPGQKLMI